MFRIGQYRDTENVSVLVLGRGEEVKSDSTGHRVSLWEDENVLKLNYSNGSQPCECTKSIELYIFNGWTIWYVNYISIKLFIKRSKKRDTFLWLSSWHLFINDANIMPWQEYRE